MVPRRRIPLDWRDAVQWLAAPFRKERAARDVQRFERAFAEKFGLAHAVAVASGRDALMHIIDALKLRAGDELVIPAYTLGELLPLLQTRGLVLRCADVDPITFNVTRATVEKACNERTRAVLVLHMFGAPCDVIGIKQLLASRGIFLIEDCAHAPGATVNGTYVGCYGHAALFSLEANKAIGTYGGGVVGTSDSEVAGHVRSQLASRTQTEWPSMKKALLKWLEEWAIRSPLYGPVARYFFDDSRSSSFDQRYRALGGRVRAQVRFAGWQARVGLRKLGMLDERNRRVAQLHERIDQWLPKHLKRPDRSRFGTPVSYNYTVKYEGDIRRFRQLNLMGGCDVGIFGEVMDDCASRLGQEATGSGMLSGQVVSLPFCDGMSPSAEAKAKRCLVDSLRVLDGNRSS